MNLAMILFGWLWLVVLICYERLAGADLILEKNTGWLTSTACATAALESGRLWFGKCYAERELAAPAGSTGRNGLDAWLSTEEQRGRRDVAGQAGRHGRYSHGAAASACRAANRQQRESGPVERGRSGQRR